MRTVPIDLQRLLEMSSANVAVMAFIVITHPQMDQAVNLVLDDVDYLIDGARFHKAKGVKLKPLTDTDTAPRTTFVFPNVDYTALLKLEAIVDPARVTFYYASSASFDLRTNPRQLKDGFSLQPFWRHHSLELTDVSVNEISCSGTLRGPDFRQEQYPNLIVTQDLCPGVYAQ